MEVAELRQTMLSWMAQHGEPLHKIARFAGHSSTHVTEMFYAHLHPDHLKGAVGVIDEVLGGSYQFGNPLR
jgi:integrase